MLLRVYIILFSCKLDFSESLLSNWIQEMPHLQTSLENRKAIGFLSKTGLYPLENRIATKPAFDVGHYRPASKMLFKWRFPGGPMMARFLRVVGSSLPSSMKRC